MKAETPTKLERYRRYWANHPVGASLLFVVAVTVGLAAFAESFSKLSSIVQSWFASKPSPFYVYVLIENADTDQIQIDQLVECQLTESQGAVIEEYPSTRALLHYTDTDDLGAAEYTLRGRESREYRFEVPDTAGYKALLQRGAANLHCIARLSGSGRLGIGSIPFQRDLLKSSRILIRVNLPP